MKFDLSFTKWIAWQKGAEDSTLAESSAANFPLKSYSKSLSYKSEHIPRNMRRRMSGYSQLTAGLALDCVEGQSVHHCVFATRHGEVSNTVSLVQALSQGQDLSPTQFSQSVHNAASGLYSIISGRIESIETVSASENSLVAGLVSVAAYLKVNPDHQVLFVYSDESMHELLVEFVSEHELSGVGIAILFTGESFRHDEPISKIQRLAMEYVMDLRQECASTQEGPGQAGLLINLFLGKESSKISLYNKHHSWSLEIA